MFRCRDVLLSLPVRCCLRRHHGVAASERRDDAADGIGILQRHHVADAGERHDVGVGEQHGGAFSDLARQGDEACWLLAAFHDEDRLPHAPGFGPPVIWSVEQLPREIAAARAGRGMFNMPRWLRDPLSLVYTRWIARRTTLQSAANRYAAALGAVDALLGTIQDDEWQRGARFYGERFYSVEDLCHTPAQHLIEHRPTIEHLLG